MISESIENDRIILNALFLDKLGKQSGTYFMAISVIQELFKIDERYMILSTENFIWAAEKTIRVKPFPKKFRFIVESIYRMKFKENTWLHFDYFLPYQGLGKNGKDIVIIHDVLPLDVKNSVSKLKKNWFKSQVHRTIAKSQAVVTISDFSRDRILTYFPNSISKVKVIPNPINMSRFESSQKMNEYNSEDKYLCTVSSVWPHKNLDTIIAAFKEIYNKKKVKLYVCGARSNMNKINQSQDCVKFLGFVSDLQLATIIKNSEAFVAPSLYEGFGMTVYEALGLGKFVLASDLAVYKSHPNLIRVSSPEDVKSWSSSIQKFLDIEYTHIPFSMEDFHPKVVAIKYHNIIREVDALKI